MGYIDSLEHNASRIDEHRLGKAIEVQFLVADVEIAVPHGLGAIPPKRWRVVYQDIAGTVYDSIAGTAWDETNAYLKCTATAKVVIRFELPLG